MPRRSGGLGVEIDVDADNATRELTTFERTVARTFGRSAAEAEAMGDRMSVAFGGMTTGVLAVGTAMVAGSVATAIYVKDLSVMAVELDKVSNSTDITTDSLSKLSEMVVKGGGDIDGVTDIANDFTEKLGDARDENEGLRESFKKLGVDINGNVDKALNTSIETLSEMEDQSLAMFRGIELFGDQYKVISDQIAEGGTIASQKGLFSKQFIESSKAINTSLSKLKTTMTRTMTTAFGPLLGGFEDLFAHLEDTGTIDIFTDYLEDVGTVAEWVMDKFNELAGVSPIPRNEQALELERKRLAKSIDVNKARLDSINQMEKDASDTGLKISKGLVAEREVLIEKQITNAKRLHRVELKQAKAIRDAKKGSGHKSPTTPTTVEDIPEEVNANAMGMSDEEYQIFLDNITKARKTIDRFKADLNDNTYANVVTTPNIFKQMFGTTPEEITASAVEYGNVLMDASQSIMNSVFDMKNAEREREIDAQVKARNDEINGMIITNRRKQQLLKKAANEEDKLRRESFEQKKKQDSANAILNMASSIGGAWASAMQLGAPANIIVGSATSALMTATGLAQIAAINSATYANGGILDGPSHANGGIQTPFGEVEGGEAVINKRSTAMFRNELSAINEAGGGKSFGNGGSGDSSSGGVTINIESFSGSQIDIDALEDAIIKLQSNSRI